MPARSRHGVVHTPILRDGHTAWRTVTAASSGVIVDAADYYHAVYWAARRAKRSILMSGWEFDSGVPLLRGADAPPADEVRLRKFLNGLCERTRDLQVYLLVWNYHPILAAEREWLQRLVFRWMTHDRLHFRVVDAAVPHGSHHQKFVVIDGRLGFLGGMDVCEGRYDDRRHLAKNPVRRSRASAQKPYHDVQAYVAGGDAPIVLEDYFFQRWREAGGTVPSLAPPVRETDSVSPRGALVLGPSQIALSRTEPHADGHTVREVEHVFVDAITAAERLIYIETQYFSSRRIFRALTERMRDRQRPRLEIVVIVNERAEAVKEEIAVGLRQTEIIIALDKIAAETGTAFGCYFSLPDGASHDGHRATYIHSKVMVIDDRFLTVGSANLTNRSMGIDTELHASWEAAVANTPLARAIRRVRISLLAEHAGVAGFHDVRALTPIGGLVPRLDALSRRPGARLRKHGPPTSAQEALLALVDPQSLPFDSDESQASAEAALSEPIDTRRRRTVGVSLAGAAMSLRRIGGALRRRR